MAKLPNRVRKPRQVTIDDKLVSAAMKVAASAMPPIANVSRMLDAAMVDFIAKRTKRNKR